jgi:hypothetical protein
MRFIFLTFFHSSRARLLGERIPKTPCADESDRNHCKVPTSDDIEQKATEQTGKRHAEAYD